MTWFKQISIKEYDDLIKNKNKLYNITPHFTSPELLNKNRDDDEIINKKIETDEKLNTQNQNLLPEIIDDDEDDEDDDDDDNSIVPVQDGRGTLNNIKIDENALNKNILKIRYLNGRKLNNRLLKHDYKISKNMKEAIRFNKNIPKLSQNEKNIHYELEKYINKDKFLDVLIGNYLSGSNNKKLFNRINKILYYKYKNNLITQKEYTNMLNQINKT